MKFNFKSNNNKKIISASISLIMLLSGCAVNKINQTDNTSTVTQGTYITTESQIQAAQSDITSESAVETFESSEPTLVTETIQCPIEYNEDNLNGFSSFLRERGYELFSNNLPYCLGYDNPKLQELLEEYCEQVAGQPCENVSVDSFQYFQYYGGSVLGFGYTGGDVNSLYETYNSEVYPVELARLLNAVLIETNSRFMIDEIPYSYFESRFPEFTSDLSAEYQISLNEDYSQMIYRIYDESTNKIDISNLSDYEYDLLLYNVCQVYNCERFYLIYNADVRQVRDLSTGRNVLVPNDVQLSGLNNHFGSFVGGDVMQVETREHFYETYGMYPEDALYRETRYEGNVTETNTMYATAPSRQR